MKKTVLAIIALCTITLSVNAQDEMKEPREPRERPQLTVDQRIEMQTMQVARMLKLDEDQRAALLQINTDHDAMVKSILNEEQIKRYDELQMMQNQQGGRPGGNRPQRGDKPEPKAPQD